MNIISCGNVLKGWIFFFKKIRCRWQGGYFPTYGGHYPFHQQFGQGGSFATASGGFFGGGHHGFGGNSHANAQSGSFNFGPFGFNYAQAGAGARPNRFF